MSERSFAVRGGEVRGCRHCELGRSLFEQAFESQAAGAEGRAFPLPGDAPRWSRPRPFRLETIRLDIALELDTRSVRATAELDIRRVDPEADTVVLDALDFTIEEVSRDGRPTDYTYDGEALTIPVGLAATLTTVRVRYRATPRRGMYFVRAAGTGQGRDPNGAPTEVWTQGQDEDNHHWLPCFDHPGERVKTDIKVEAPAGWFVLSNGVLAEKGDAHGKSFHRWRQDEPHPIYLVTIAAGQFDEAHDRHGELPIDYYVPRGQGGLIPRSLGMTPRMIAHFEERLGTKFPWAKYAQVVVHDFIFGGMENTSATTLFDRVLVDERAALDVDMESLVSHELAHQWFGDLVTCRDWSHAWLNEGFATYLEHLWREHAEGLDAYHFGLEGDLDLYLDEERERYRRPIVTNVWAQPIDIFDRHLYQKGGLVLHALRRHLGDTLFFRGIANYLATMRGRNAETRDLLRALEETSGRSLEAFFDQWVFRGGHPALEVAAEHEKGVLKLTVTQTQAKAGEASSLFQLTLPVRIVAEDGTASSHELVVQRGRETFALPLAKAPKAISIDPTMDVVGTIDLKLPTAWLVGSLRHASEAQARWRSARALGKKNEPRATRALLDALASDASWGVRTEAALALGEQRAREAIPGLGSALADANARVRRAAASALGRFQGEPSAHDLLARAIAAGDRSYLVEGELRRALGKVRDARAFEILVRAFETDPRGWNDALRVGAVDGLAALKDARTIPYLVRATGAEQTVSVRRTAYGSLGRTRDVTTDEPLLASLRDRAIAAFEEGSALFAFDPGVRIAAARAIAGLRDAAGIGPIARLAERDLDGRVRRHAREALRDLRDRTARGREVAGLRDQVDGLSKELRDLREKLLVLEARGHGGPPTDAAKSS